MNAAEPPSTEQFKERVVKEWTDSNTVAAWSKWHSKIAVVSAEAKEALVRAAQVEPGMQVLDIASGTGEPSLTLAEVVGPEGHVTATDLGSDMIAVAKENAEKVNLTNMTFLQADAHDLPFSDRSFDRVTCRFGVMFFADLPQALGEIYRVLKPGGRVAFTAWGPVEQNPYLSTTLTPFLKRVEVPPPLPGAPQPFRFAEAGTLAAELQRAGFEEVQEETRTMSWAWPGPPEEVWEHVRDVAVPFHPIIYGLEPEARKQAIGEVVEGYRRYYDGQKVNLPAEIVLASGVR
jgi:ubiquinone/menaquinone biosynthesis C-methylase UbiE